MNLTELKVGDFAYILDIEVHGKELKRLLELGFVNKTKINVVCVAPKGFTWLVAIRGYLLALDKKICEQIKVEKC